MLMRGLGENFHMLGGNVRWVMSGNECSGSWIHSTEETRRVILVFLDFFFVLKKNKVFST